ncbi:hypothetical protein ACLB1E_19480 [Escherichia coli]
MLKPEMIEKLNEQMNLELYSSLLYQRAPGAAIIPSKVLPRSCAVTPRKR